MTTYLPPLSRRKDRLDRLHTRILDIQRRAAIPYSDTAPSTPSVPEWDPQTDSLTSWIWWVTFPTA
jgi:hypothetical protein